MQHAENLFSSKTENFMGKNFDSFNISAQNIDGGYMLEPPWRSNSNEYPQSMFWINIKKNLCTPIYPSFSI